VCGGWFFPYTVSIDSQSQYEDGLLCKSSEVDRQSQYEEYGGGLGNL
jgi:hypothetical protein